MRSALITIRGTKGEGSHAFPKAEWDKLAPASKVLALHGALRRFTQGRPFEILSVKTIEG